MCAFISLQLQGASAELPRRVEALLSISRMQVGLGGASQAVLLGPGKIDNQSLVEMHEVSLSDLSNNSLFCGITFF